MIGTWSIFALIPDLRGIICGILEIVAVGHPAAYQFHQLDGNLAVMHRSGGQHGV
jgi:hypothetical protein